MSGISALSGSQYNSYAYRNNDKKESLKETGAHDNAYSLDTASISDEAKRLSFEEKAKIMQNRNPHSTDNPLSPSGEFMKVMLNRPDSHEDTLKALAEKYALVRDDIRSRYGDDEEVLNQKLNALDKKFKAFLESTGKIPIRQMEKAEIYTSHNDEELEANQALIKERAEQKKNFDDIAKNYTDNMHRHIRTFFDSFTTEIKEKNFEAAFSDSLAIIKNTKTNKNGEISYDEMQVIFADKNNTQGH